MMKVETTGTKEWPRPDRMFVNKMTEHFCKCFLCGRRDAVHTIHHGICSSWVECCDCGVIYDDCGEETLTDRRPDKNMSECEYVGVIPDSNWSW